MGRSISCCRSRPYVPRRIGLSPTMYLHGGARGDELALRFEAEVLRAAVRPAPEARIVEERKPGSGEPSAISVRFEPGHVATDRNVSEAGAFLLDALAGAPSVEVAVARFAEAAGAAADGARRTVLDFVHEGLSRGVLVRG